MVIDKENVLYANDLTYRIVKPSNLALLLRSLKENRQLMPLVRRLEFYGDFHEMDTNSLLQLVDKLSKYKSKNAKSPLEYLVECNVNGYYTFLKMSRDISHSVLASGPGMVYENDEIDDVSPSIPLQSYEISDVRELQSLPTGYPIDLEVSLESDSQPAEKANGNSQFRSIHLKNTKSLKLLDCIPDLSNTASLCLTLSSCKELNPRLEEMASLKQFELRLSKYVSSHNSRAENIASLPLWNTLLSKELESLSLINLNYNNLLSNSGSRDIFQESNLFYSLLKHCRLFNDTNWGTKVKYINFCFNTFAVLPNLSKDEADYKSCFVVNEEHLYKKVGMFETLFKFTNCTTLVLPDYLFNWKPFIRFQRHHGSYSLDANYNFDHFQYLIDGCNCSDCTATREILHQKLAPTPETEASAYSSLIRLVYRRIPDLCHELGSRVMKKPFVNTLKTICTDKSDLERIFKLMLDNLQVDIAALAHQFPHLQRLCLGGFAIYIERTPDGIIASAPQDHWRAQI